MAAFDGYRVVVLFLVLVLVLALHVLGMPQPDSRRVTKLVGLRNSTLFSSLSSSSEEEGGGLAHSAQYIEDIMRLSKAAEMRNYMYEQADPCKDFYKFACGNWARINPANTLEDITTGFFETMSKALNRKLAVVLKAPRTAEDTEVDNKVRDFYESCTRIRELKSTYASRLREIVAEFGQMPVLAGTAWRVERFDWLETVAKIAHKYGKDIIIGLDVIPDYANNTRNRVYIGYPEFPLESRTMYLENVTAIYRSIYRSKVEDELRRFLGLSAKLAEQTAREMLEFEVELARGMIDESLGMDLKTVSVLTTVAEMQRKYAPTIDVERLVSISLGESVTDGVYEFAEQYQKNLLTVIKNTPQRTIANYIFYMLLVEFMRKPAKTPAKQERACIDVTKTYFAKNLDNMVYRRYNNNDTERDIAIIWEQLKETFRAELSSEKLNWIQPATRKYAEDKLDTMKLEINNYAVNNFSKEFERLVMSKHDYIENIKTIMHVNSQQVIEELHQPAKPLEAGELLSYTPANIILENVIKMPVSMLQPYYLWASSYPTALKFATIASLVGHELIHSFDDQGRKYDIDGNRRDWWDKESTEAFERRQDCFVNQYSKYLYGGRPLPKSASQSENIADNGGVRMAYAAYLRWYEDAVRSGRDMSLETLPNMNYTSKQLFFISFAQIWCNDAHPGVLDLQTSTDQHVPGKYRVIGPLSNFDEFAKEFNCPRNSKMNPQQKCEIY